jgi:predicted house-cleaning noncanonical NTP pyrophosphatase (MazG superfamily)
MKPTKRMRAIIQSDKQDYFVRDEKYAKILEAVQEYISDNYSENIAKLN